jgi:hypothetical protein
MSWADAALAVKISATARRTALHVLSIPFSSLTQNVPASPDPADGTLSTFARRAGTKRPGTRNFLLFC